MGRSETRGFVVNQYKVFKRIDVFKIFKQFVFDYADKKILDFGGNRGNLIHYSNGEILEENYTCLDVSREALECLIEEHPNATAVHWDRYHNTYNPTGSVSEKFPKLTKGLFGILSYYDICFANSVFTHMSVKEMLFCLRYLQYNSNEIYFTYIDPENTRIFEVLRKRHGVINLSDKEIESLKEHDCSYIYDGKSISQSYCDKYQEVWTIIKTDYLKELIAIDSPYIISMDSGMSTGFNWLKIKLEQRPPPIGMINY